MPNKKYYQLDNKAWLLKQLQTMTMAELATQIGCHHGSVLYATRYFTDAEKATIKLARVHKSVS